MALQVDDLESRRRLSKVSSSTEQYPEDLQPHTETSAIKAGTFKKGLGTRSTFERVCGNIIASIMAARASVILVVLVSISVLFVAVITGIFYFNYIPFSGSSHRDRPSYKVLYYLDKNVNRKNIEKHLYKFTEELGWKVAGTAAETDAAYYIQQHFKDIGLRGVKLVPYQVLLSYPDPQKLNTLKVLDNQSAVVFEANNFENMSLPFVTNQTNYPYYLRSIFNAYSASGDVTGPIIYVKYARKEDLEAVKDKLGPSVICLARYGKLSRIVKAEYAQDYGCGGMVLYSDPDEYNVKGNTVFYPFSEYLPATGVQRGTLKNQNRGDYLTPAYPATPEAYRLEVKDADLPKIPLQVIREDDAYVILKKLGFNSDGDRESDNDVNATLSVNLQTLVRETNNVVGLIPGKEEPDRYVIVGNHYDSWGPGSIDPNIGSSIVMELSRVLMAYHNQTGWQPRRSIIFCEWGAEEYGSLGSREFVEEFSKLLRSRTVAYINTDVAVLGSYSVKFKSQPLLKKLILNTTKNIWEPQRKYRARKSLYDTYMEKFPDKKNNRPKIYDANTGSDYVHFIGLAGVPSLDVRYTYDESLGLGFYPLYHSAYENFHAFKKFIDPEFKYSEVITKVMGNLAVKLASEPVIPYSVDEYVEYVEDCVSTVEEKLKTTKDLLSASEISRLKLDVKLENFSKKGKMFIKDMHKVDVSNELEVRMLNDRMMLLQKAFMYEHTFEGRETVRNALHAPSNYGQVCLAELNTMLKEYNHPKTQKAKAKEEILKEVARIHYFVDTAASIFNSFFDSM